MDKAGLPKRTLLLWQIRVLLLTAVAVFACLYFKNRFSFIASFSFIFAIIGFAVIVWYLPQFFKGYEMVFKNEAVIINYGVFIKFSHIMPYSRLIYAQTFATPLARLFGVTALSLKAARSRVIVPEILNCDAQTIMDSLTGELQDEEKI